MIAAEDAPVAVVCAVIERNGLFLAAQRAAGQSNALLWEFPGGKVNHGENAEEALKRELYEELGISVKVLRQLTPGTYSYPWIVIELIPYVCTMISGEPHPHEHTEIRWVDKDEALRLPWAPADVPVVKEYLFKVTP